MKDLVQNTEKYQREIDDMKRRNIVRKQWRKCNYMMVQCVTYLIMSHHPSHSEFSSTHPQNIKDNVLMVGVPRDQMPIIYAGYYLDSDRSV